MATKSRQHYRDTRTGAIRISSTPMGYPYEKVTKAEADADSTSTTDSAGGAQPNAGETKKVS